MIETNEIDMGQRIIAKVEANPGLRIADLIRELNSTHGRVYAKVLILATNGQLRVERNNRRETRVYPATET